ncbi:MAG: acyl carrier protein [Oscillospiraceae bacterium]|jgi:acyl carrier protein|nr:acyl carrier protein [Oscillospiraceae bacterium]
MEKFDQIREIIVNTLGCAESAVNEDTNIKEDLGADSLAVVELVMAIEDAFGISINEEKMAEIQTVGDIVTLVNANV